ncbi:MAG: IclR family transcriptional regulator [Rhodococcus sp. (in: high G+C Gram-positive bacteria)]
MTTPVTPEPRIRGDDTSVGKALALLDAFSGRLGVIGVTALAERAEISKSTAHRLLKVLVAGGYVRRVGDRYCLSEHVFEMGNQVRSCRPNGLRDVAMPYLGELFAETRQTVQIAVLSGTEVLYLDKVAGRDAALCPTQIGARRPAYATALGKVLLAFSDTQTVEENLQVPFRRFTPHTMATAQFAHCLTGVRSDGIATDHEELRRGVNCVAAPVLDSRTGRAIAAVSVCSVTASAERRHLRALQRITGELSTRLHVTGI